MSDVAVWSGSLPKSSESVDLRARNRVNEKIPRQARMMYHTLSGIPDCQECSYGRGKELTVKAARLLFISAFHFAQHIAIRSSTIRSLAPVELMRFRLTSRNAKSQFVASNSTQ